MQYLPSTKRMKKKIRYTSGKCVPLRFATEIQNNNNNQKARTTQHKTATRNENVYRCSKVCTNTESFTNTQTHTQSKETKKATTANFEHLK